MAIFDVLEKVKPMHGGSTFRLQDNFRNVLIYHKEDSLWQENSGFTMPETTDYEVYCYQVVKKRTSNSVVASYGVYIDVTVTFSDLIRSIEQDFVPQYTWLPFATHNTRFRVYNEDTRYYVETNLTNRDFNGSPNFDSSGLPGILMEYEIKKEPNEYLEERYICVAKYRYWLCSDLDIVLNTTANLIFMIWFNNGDYDNGSTYKTINFNNIRTFSCPNGVSDDVGFGITYDFTTLNNVDYIQFALLDELERPISDYRTDVPLDNSYYYFYSWTPEELELLYEKYKDTTEGPIYLSMKYKKYNQDPMIVSYSTTFTIASANPTIDVTLVDSANIIPNSDEVFVNLLSDLKVIVNPQAYKGATVTRFGIEHNGQVYINELEAVFPGVTDRRVTVFCEDSRGNQISKDLVLDGWIPYFPPTCSITASKPTSDDKIPIFLSGKYFDDYYSFDNSYSIYYQYASSNPENKIGWTELTPKPTITLDSSNRFKVEFYINVPNHVDIYTVQIQFRDKYRSYDSNSTTVASDPIFDWSKNDFNFNIPVNINGDLTVSGTITNNTPVEKDPDYIVEQGTITTGSGNSAANWVYRKWNSGIAECWCRKHVSTAVNNVWGNLYVSGALSYTNITWGVDFIDIPVANITIAPNASGAFLIAGGSTSLTKDKTGGYEIARGSALASAGNFYINYYGIGRWK